MSYHGGYLGYRVNEFAHAVSTGSFQEWISGEFNGPSHSWIDKKGNDIAAHYMATPRALFGMMPPDISYSAFLSDRKR